MLQLKVLTTTDLQSLNLKSVWDLPHATETESGEILGYRPRKGVGGLSFWTALLKLPNGNFKRRDRMDLTGRNPEEFIQ